MRRLFPRVDDTLRLVDEGGLVGCRRTGTDVRVEVCLHCPALLHVCRDVEHRLTQVHCRPPVGAPGVLGPFAV